MDEVKEDYYGDADVDDDADENTYDNTDDDDEEDDNTDADDADVHAGKSVLLVGFAREGGKFTGGSGFCDSFDFAGPFNVLSLTNRCYCVPVTAVVPSMFQTRCQRDL